MTWHFISWVKQGKIIKECLLQPWELHRFLLIRFLYQVIQVRRVKRLCGPVRNFRRFFMQTMTSSTTLAFFVTCLLRVSFFKIFRVKKEICILRLILKARISRTGDHLFNFGEKLFTNSTFQKQCFTLQSSFYLL